MLKITREDFSIDEVVQKIKSKETGAIVSFMGFVRGKSKDKIVGRFEIQVSEEMAIRRLEKIRAEILQKFNVNQIAIVQRIGSLKVSENVLLIVVGASHRDEAFKACRDVLEQMKKVAKMWEKETYTEGKPRD